MLLRLDPGGFRSVLPSMARWGGFLVVAGVGIGLAASMWRPIAPGELDGEWKLARTILSGGGGGGYGLQGAANAYPLPSELLFLPIGLLGGDMVGIVGRALSFVLIGLALWLWRGETKGPILPALISLPAIQAVLSDHLMSAFGLLALSLAVWARGRQRWMLCGAALALGGGRIANAFPVAVVLLLAGRRGWSWSRVARIFVGGLIVTLPLTTAAFLLDPGWPRQYLANLAAYGSAGLVQVMLLRFGILGGASLVVGIAIIGTAAAWRRGTDGMSIALALSVLSAPMQGPYAAIFALPAQVRLGGRPGYITAAYLGSASLWLAFILATQFNEVVLLSGAGLWLLVAAYPLLRKRVGRINVPTAVFGRTDEEESKGGRRTDPAVLNAHDE